MNKKIVAISFLIIAILFVSAIVGTIIYYNNQILNLKSQIKNMTTANLVTSLGIAEIQGNESRNGNGEITPVPYNYLFITGSVNNTAEANAYNAGLHVVAYSATGKLEINMTVPFYGIYGTDNATNTFVLENYGGSLNPTLGILYAGQTASLNPYGISILHEGTVSKWTVTPVWTNSP